MNCESANSVLDRREMAMAVERVVIPKLQGPEFLDGALEAPAWDQATRVNLEIEQGSTEPPENPTEVYVFHDGVWLYVGWRCHDPDISGLQMKRRTLQMDTCEGDSVRLWLDVAVLHRKRDIWEFQIDPYANCYRLQGDLRGYGYVDPYGVETEAEICDTSWTAEFRVLLSDVGIDPAKTNLVGINAGRAFRGKRIYSWVESDADVATGWAFATLDTGDEALTHRSLEAIDKLLKKCRQAHALPDTPGEYRISNSQVAASVFGPANRPTLWIGKSDVHDRRILRKDVPLITLKDIREAAFADSGDWADSAVGHTALGPYGMRSNVSKHTPQLVALQRRNDWNGAYAFPCPKPVGQIIVGLPFDEEECLTDVQEDVAIRSVAGEWIKGHYRVHARQGDRAVTLRIYLRPRSNVVVIEGHCRNMAGDELRLRVFRHRDTLRAGPAFAGRYSEHYDYMSDAPQNRPLDPPTAKAENGVISITQDLPADPTFPEGFQVVLAGGVNGAEILGSRAEQTRLGLGTPVGRKPGSVYAQNWPERFNAAPGSAATLTMELQDNFLAAFAVATTGDDPEPEATAKRLVRDTLALSAADLWAEYVEAERADYVGNYHYNTDVSITGSGVRWAKHCYDDTEPWHGDFHFNEMFSRCPRYFIRGLHDELESYYQLIESMMPAARDYAREVFDCAGAAFPCTHYPVKTDKLIQNSLDWDFSMELTAEVMKPFWMHYLYVCDKAFLEKRAYPVLRDGARFYADFVTPEDDGYYHVVPTTSAEHWGITRDFMLNKDTQSALTMAKYHLNAAAQAAKILGRDPEDARRWGEIASRMAPYPTAETRRGTIFLDVRGATYIKRYYNIPTHLAAVNWGDDITLESPPELVATAMGTIQDYLENPVARLGYATQALARLGVCFGDEIFPEKLLQSHSGVLRVFPAVPEGYTGRFEDFRAQGGFSVTAEMKDGRIRHLEITSKVGNPCCLARPWPGEVHLLDATTGMDIPVQPSDRYLRFKTEVGKTYQVVPAE